MKLTFKLLFVALALLVSQAMASQQDADSPSTSDISEEVTLQVNAWAAAWSDRNFEAYTGFYGAGFEPARKLSRTQWEKVRKARILKRPRLKVAIDDIKIDVVAPDQAIATFNQKYWSKSYRDRTYKTLSFVKVEDNWVIVREQTSKCSGNTTGGCKSFKKKGKRARK